MIILAGTTLQEAIRRYQSGDSAAFDIIYHESIKYTTKCVLNVLSRTAPDASDDLVQDILQDTYLTIASNLHTLRSPEAFLQWAGQIATHHAQRTWNKDIRRQQMEQPEDDLVYELADENFIPEDILENKEKQQMIRKMLEELPTNQYLCVLEYFYNGLKEAEVAEKLGMPLNTVKTNLSRAKKKLKTIVETHEKKSGVKLYSMGWLLLAIFWKELRSFFVEPQLEENTLRFIRNEMGGYSDISTPQSTGSGNSNAASGASSAGKALLSTTGAKLGAIMLTAAVVIGSAVGLRQMQQKPQELTSVTQTTVPTVPTTVSPTETVYEPEKMAVIRLLISSDPDPLPEEYSVLLANDETGEATTQLCHGTQAEITAIPGEYTLTVEAAGYDPYTVQFTAKSGVYTDVICAPLVPSVRLYSQEELAAIANVISILGIPSGGDSAVLWQADSSGVDTAEIMWLTLKNAMWYDLGIDTQPVKSNSELITAYCVDAGNYLYDLFHQVPNDLYYGIRTEYGFTDNNGSQLTLWYPPSLGSIGTRILQIQQIMPDTIQVLAQLKTLRQTTGSTPGSQIQFGDCLLVTLVRSRGNMGWSYRNAIRFPADSVIIGSDTENGLMSIPYDETTFASVLEGSVIFLNGDTSGTPSTLFPQPTGSGSQNNTASGTQSGDSSQDSSDGNFPYMPKAYITAEEATDYAEMYLRMKWETKDIITENTLLFMTGEETDTYGHPCYIFCWSEYDPETGEYTTLDTVRVSAYGGNIV